MKKSELRMMVRRIVREEVAMAIKEVVNEIKEPTKTVSKKVKRTAVKNKEYVKNPILNEVMNDTAKSEEWKTMGEQTYTTDNMNDVLAKSYGDMMNDGSNNNLAAEMGVNPNNAPDFLVKDYRSIMKAIDKKQGKT